MNERPEDKLTTADVAAAAEPRRAEPAADPGPGEQERLRAETPRAPVTGQRERDEAQATALFATEETQRFRERWDDVQTGFVDEPRQAVEYADSLVAEVMKRLAEIFADERGKLEGQWSRGADVSTEELRVALRRYRSFFDRLLSYGGQGIERGGTAAEAMPAAPRARPQAGPPAADSGERRGGQGTDGAPAAVAEPSTAGPAAERDPTRATAATTTRWEDEMPRLRARWEQHHGTQGERWEAYEPCYRYAWEMRHDARYGDRPWQEVEPELRRDWEQRHPDTPWERAGDAIRDAWESLTGAPAR